MKKEKDSAALRWIWRVSGKAKRWTFLLTAVRILQAAVGIAHAYVLGGVVDRAADGVDAVFFRQVLWFAALALLTVLLQTVGRWLGEKSRVSLETAFRQQTFAQLLSRDYKKFTQTHTGEWMNRITSDAGVVATGAAQILPELTGSLVRMLAALAALVSILPRLVYVLIPGGAVMMLLSWFMRRHMKVFHKRAQQADGRVRSFMQERLSAMLVVRSFTQEEASVRQAKELQGLYAAARMRRQSYVSLCSAGLSGAIHAAQVLGVGLCGWGILKGTVSFGTLSTVLQLINMVSMPVTGITAYVSQFSSMLASAERMMEIESYAADCAENPVEAAEARRYYAQQMAAFGMEDACFAYEDGAETVLQKFDLQVQKGEFVAFTGDSGCGKSTALKVLLGLYPLQQGVAYLQDADGQRRTLDAAWRSLFAYVPQGNQLLSGTVRETLTFGNAALMRQEDALHQALEIACADFVYELPQGLDTLLGEQGSGLSEGQMQRLSIARAVFSQRPVLFLDEATSALDPDTEQRLLQNLRNMTDRTVLIITHRPAALEYCDRHIHFERTTQKA